jgi:hypothetical protein
MVSEYDDGTILISNNYTQIYLLPINIEVVTMEINRLITFYCKSGSLIILDYYQQYNNTSELSYQDKIEREKSCKNDFKLLTTIIK